MDCQKNAETSSIDFYTQLVTLKTGRSSLKIYGLIFEEKEKFNSESLNQKFVIFQKSVMKFLIHLF